MMNSKKFFEIILGEGRDKHFDYVSLENLAFTCKTFCELIAPILKKHLLEFSNVEYGYIYSTFTQFRYYLQDGKRINHGLEREIITYVEGHKRYYMYRMFRRGNVVITLNYSDSGSDYCSDSD